MTQAGRLDLALWSDGQRSDERRQRYAQPQGMPSHLAVFQGGGFLHYYFLLFQAPNYQRWLSQVAPAQGIAQRAVPRSPVGRTLRIELQTLNLDHQGVSRLDPAHVNWPCDGIGHGRRIAQIPCVQQVRGVLWAAIAARRRIFSFDSE